MAGANETYTIDIQAAMPEGDSVSAKLDALSTSLLGGTKSAEYFDAAISQTSKAIAAAKAATADADSELQKGNELWAELEANATRAAKAFEKAAARGPVTKDIADQALASKTALDAYATTLEQLEKNASNAATSEKALSAFMIKARQAASDARAPGEAAKQAAGELGGLRTALTALPGPLGKLANAALVPAQGFKKLTGNVGASNASALLAVAGYAALAAAVVVVTVALAAATIKVAAWAVGLADANRSAALSTEAFNAMNPALAGLDFGPLTDETGQSAKALQGLAKDLTKAGVSADRMGKSLRVAALASTALGPEGAAQYTALEQAATDAQKAVDEAAKNGGKASAKQLDALTKARKAADEFAATAQTKLGGIVSRQMLGLEAQSERFSRNIDGLFGGLDIDPVLHGLSTLVALFDKNTAAGAALQFLFETFFQPLIDTASTAATAIEAFYLGVLIGAMKLYISLKPTIKAVEEFFGLDSSPLQINFQDITKLGEALAPIFEFMAVVVGGTLAAAFVTIGAIIAAQIAVWYAVVKAVQGVIAVWGIVIDTIKNVYNYLTSVDLAAVGSALITGLARGIYAGAGAVVSAVTNSVGGAINAAKRMLGIASPSKVFASIGENTGEGFTGGVEDSTSAAHDAIATMANPSEAMDQAALSGDVATLERLQGLDAAGAPQPAAPPAGASAGASAGAAGGSRTVTLYNPVIQLGAGSPKEQAQEFVTWITELLEGDAAQAAGA